LNLSVLSSLSFLQMTKGGEALGFKVLSFS
jgi:hypothetical protein